MNSIRLLFIVALVVGPLTARGQDLCDLDYSKLNSLQINEKELTQEKYEEALSKLGKIISKDYTQYNETEFSIALTNALNIVKGYALKTWVQSKEGESKYEKITFCSWLENAHWVD